MIAIHTQCMLCWGDHCRDCHVFGEKKILERKIRGEPLGLPEKERARVMRKEIRDSRWKALRDRVAEGKEVAK